MDRLGGVDRHPAVLLLLADLLVLGAVVALGVPGKLAVLLLAAAALSPLLWAIVQRPQRGVLLLAVAAPLEGLLPVLPPIPFGSSLIEALVVLTLGATFVAPAAARRTGARPAPTWLPPFVAFLVVGLASGVVVGLDQGLVGWKITYFYALVGWAIWRCPLTRRDRDHLVSILMVLGVVTGLYGLLQQLMGGARLAAMGYEYNSTIRFAGPFLRSFSTFVQPFGFGLFQALVLIVCLPVALQDRGRRRNRWFLWSLPLLGVALLSSIVRAAWMAAAVGIAYVAASRHRSLLLVAPVVVVLALFLPADAVRTALSTSSTNERAVGWQENIDAVVEHPFGLGIGETGSAAIVASVRGVETGERYQPDNWYVKVVLELGVLGLWFFLLFFAGTFSATRGIARRARGVDAAFSAGVAGSLLAAAVASLTATYFEIFPMDLFFWVLVVAVAAAPDEDAPEGADRSRVALAAR